MRGKMSESPEHRLKRMRMRAWHRGMKEMDLIFGPWADDRLAGLDAARLDLFDAIDEGVRRDGYAAMFRSSHPGPLGHRVGVEACQAARFENVSRRRHHRLDGRPGPLLRRPFPWCHNDL